MVIATAAIIAFVLIDFLKRPWQAFLLTIFFSVSPAIILPGFLTVRDIHHVFAWFFFWVAVLLLRRWFATQRRPFLIWAVLTFGTSVLFYEATALLLPIALVFSHKDLTTKPKFLRAIRVVMGITGMAGLIYFSLSALRGSWGLRGRALDGSAGFAGLLLDLLKSPANLIDAIAEKGLAAVAFEQPGWATIVDKFFLIALAGGMLATAIWFLTGIKKGSSGVGPSRELKLLALAGLWLVFITYLPFAVQGQDPNANSIKGAGFGAGMIALTVIWSFKAPGAKFIANVLLLAFFAFYISSGLITYGRELSTDLENDRRFGVFVHTLKDQVPCVHENTTFVFVGPSFGRTGCIGMMNMLFARNNLHCIHLIENDTEETYTRTADLLVEDTGREFQPDFIILTIVADGTARLLDEITMEDYPDLPITWLDKAPIATNAERIRDFPIDTDASTPFSTYMEQYYLGLDR